VKLLAWLRHQLDRVANRFNGQCPDEWNDCPSDCRMCARLDRRWTRMRRYLNERALPEARIE
jgi:hypothetical protein